MEYNDDSPLCCCEYIDHRGERNHILACCCNCIELDLCCDGVISCRGASRPEMSAVMAACLDRLRCPGRGGAYSILSLSYAVLTPFVVQPLIAITTVSYSSKIVLISSLIIVAQIISSYYMSKHKSHSPLLYYWILSSIVYSIILFEISVTPLLEIRWDENFTVVILVLVALSCFYFTRERANHNPGGERMNGNITGNGFCVENICSVCRIKISPRYVHCQICQTCIARYDHHCFWLDCCIGENNQVFFMLGLLFGSMSLIYGSLLTLTTVCRPTYAFGVLLPSDCSDATDDLTLGISYMSAVYCMGLSIPALLQLCHHCWLVSRGISGEEWRLQGYNPCATNPYSRRFLSNWWNLLTSLSKLRL